MHSEQMELHLQFHLFTMHISLPLFLFTHTTARPQKQP